ncbi:MAG: HAMP domain-containing sensor histidine kinase [Actinobacteria bacterium]|nr:HAMP domain-containing sensor histidine kinase [Actinomycetota bacterium]
MLKVARIKLTILYSILFLFMFWAFSIGLYFWVNNSFGESYTAQVKEQQQVGEFEGEFADKEKIFIAIAGDIAMVQLRNTLLILNGGLLIIIPALAMILTRKTLTPVQQIYEQQKQFVSDVSHELRTPLSIMSGEMEIALKKNRTTSEYIQVITSSRQELNNLTNLVENLLFLTRIDQGKSFLQSEKVDLTDVINNVIAILQEKYKKKKITLKFKPADESITISGQISMLRQLFFNIIDNAIIYTPENGKIDIALSTNMNNIIVKVTDNGIGIAPQDQKKIFERFYRADLSRSQVKGYGLGLAICQSIVSLYNGSINISSHLGKGTTVTVCLPKSGKKS